MNIDLYLRSYEGDRTKVGTGDPETFGRLLDQLGIDGENPTITLQWFNNEHGVAGVEAIYEFGA